MIRSGKSGIAHFLEHLMFKGTKDHPEGNSPKIIADLGGQENAFTSNDYTAYFQRVPNEHLRTCMDYEADRMQNLVLTDEVVAPERDVVLEERRMHTDSDPADLLARRFSRRLFTRHPYGRPVIGWAMISRARQSRRARLLRPFLYAGKRHPDGRRRCRAARVIALAEKFYGKIPPRGEPPVRWPCVNRSRMPTGS